MTILSWLQEGFLSLAPFFILLGLLIFVHELGHFAVAKWCGVRVEVFSLGFGKKLLKYKRGDTVYCISMIPLGGYVKMFGDDPSADIPESEKKYSFLHKPLLPRTAIVLAGPLMNLFFTVPLFMCVALIGQQVPGPQLGRIEADSAAYKVGFRSNDRVLRVAGQSIEHWGEVKDKIELSARQPLSFDVDRQGEAVHIQAQPEQVENDFIFSWRQQIGQIKGLSVNGWAPIVGARDPQSFLRQAGFGVLEWVVQVNEQPVATYSHLLQILQALPVGQRVEFRLLSDVKNLTEVELPIDLERTRPVVIESWSADVSFDRAELFLARVIEGTPAHKAGLKVGDELVSIAGQPLSKWSQVLELVSRVGGDVAASSARVEGSASPQSLNTNKNIKSAGVVGSVAALDFVVRRDGKLQTIAVVPKLTELPTAQGQMEKRYTVGIAPAFIEVPREYVMRRYTNPWRAFEFGVSETLRWTGFVVMSFVRLFQGRVSARNIGGVITIGVAAKRSFSAGVVSFLIMMALISLNLFLINLLPIPVLDGGHLMFFLIEAVKGSPVSVQKMQATYQVGFVLLIAFMAFALFNDITRLLSPW